MENIFTTDMVQSIYTTCATRGPHDSIQEVETFICVQFIMKML